MPTSPSQVQPRAVARQNANSSTTRAEPTSRVSAHLDTYELGSQLGSSASRASFINPFHTQLAT